MTEYTAIGTLGRRAASHFPEIRHQRSWQAVLVLLFAGVGAAGFYFPSKNDHWITAMAAFFAALVAAFGLVTIRQGRAIRRENTNVHKLNRLERAGLLVAELEHLGCDSELRRFCQRRLSITLCALQELEEKLELKACRKLVATEGESEWERVVSAAHTEIDRALRDFSLS